MQLQNASTVGYGTVVQLSQNISWVYPFAPGEPPNVLRYEFAACVPSNVTLASVCCSAVNGTFVTQDLANIQRLNETQLKTIFEQKYPGQNVTTFTSANTGNLTNATDAGSDGAIHWCSMNYNPLSSDSLQGIGYTSGGGHLGNIPQSVNSWIKCFNDNVPPEAVNNSQAAYVCTTDDVRTGGVIEGFNRYIAKQSSASRLAVSWWCIMGLLLLFLTSCN